MKNPLYQYQARLASEVLKEFHAGRTNVVLAAACGAGKTITSIAICEMLLQTNPHLRILVLTHGQVVLRTQFVEDIEAQKPNFTYRMVASCQDLDEPAQVYVGLPHTIHRCKKHKFDIIIVDEAHHFYFAADGMVQRIIKFSMPRFTLFLSGSPSKFIKEKYTLYSISLLELWELNRVCSPVIELATTTYQYTLRDYSPKDELRSNVWFSRRQTKETLDGLLAHIQRVLKSRTRATHDPLTPRKSAIWKTTLRLLDKSMFVCRNQQQAAMVKGYFTHAGVNVALSTSDVDADSDEIKRFKIDDKCKVLVVVNRGILGFNMPELVNIVDLSGSLNVDVLFQMFARLVRRHPHNKSKLFLKVVPEAMTKYVYVLMSFVVALAHKSHYETYSGDYKKVRIRVPKGFLTVMARKHTNHAESQRPLKLPPVPRIDVMKSLSHETGKLLSSYAYTTLEEVKNRLKSSFLPFEKARAFVRNVGMKGKTEWMEWSKTQRPDDIPSSPDSVYKGEWVNWGDWLGTGNECYRTKRFLSFNAARSVVRKLGLQGQRDWRKWSRTARQSNIPSNPSQYYKSEWKGWGDWLGEASISSRNRAFLSFEKARAYVWSIGLRTQTEWRKWSKTKRPDNIPGNPYKVYRNKWVSWGDWLGVTR